MGSLYCDLWQELQGGTTFIQIIAIIITKHGRLEILQSWAKWGNCYRKVRQGLLQSGAGNLLQTGSTFIGECGRYYKVTQLYYKVGRYY